MLHSQYQVSEYNRKRGHIGGGVGIFNNAYTFNQPVRAIAVLILNLVEPRLLHWNARTEHVGSLKQHSSALWYEHQLLRCSAEAPQLPDDLREDGGR